MRPAPHRRASKEEFLQNAGAAPSRAPAILPEPSEQARARIDEFISAAAAHLDAGSASPIRRQTAGLIAEILDDDQTRRSLRSARRLLPSPRQGLMIDEAVAHTDGRPVASRMIQ